MAAGAGIAARVQGLRRYYALLLTGDGRARVVRANDEVTVLADVAFDVEYFRTYELALEVIGSRIRAWVDGVLLADVVDESPLSLQRRCGRVGVRGGHDGELRGTGRPRGDLVRAGTAERTELEEARS